MGSAGPWLELGDWGRRKERKRDEGLTMRCVILTQLLLHGKEPKKKSAGIGHTNLWFWILHCWKNVVLLWCQHVGLGKTLLFPQVVRFLLTLRTKVSCEEGKNFLCSFSIDFQARSLGTTEQIFLIYQEENAFLFFIH